MHVVCVKCSESCEKNNLLDSDMWYDPLYFNLMTVIHIFYKPIFVFYSTQCALDNCANTGLNCESCPPPSETSAKLTEKAVH